MTIVQHRPQTDTRSPPDNLHLQTQVIEGKQKQRRFIGD